MIIKSVHIEKFRALHEIEFTLGRNLTAIAGRNATMKTTLLGIIGQPFSISNNNPLYGAITIDGYNFKSQFGEKFKISPDRDIIGEHKWTLFLENQGYYSDNQMTIESIGRSSNNGAKRTLRFWKAGSRNKGDGYIQLPVYFLSLSRIFPVGEAGKTTTMLNDITAEELKYYLDSYRSILSIQSIPGTPTLKIEQGSAKRVYAGIEDDVHDVFTNSAGEGNVSRIILALLSFRRLKEKYHKDYKGGILLVDEIETTLYPHAQKALITYLMQASKDFRVQIIFTTHSNIVLQAVDDFRRRQKEHHPASIQDDKSSYNSSVIYLEPDYGDDGTRMIRARNISNASELRQIINDISLMPTTSDGKLPVYTEDSIAAEFAIFLLKKKVKNIEDYVSFIDINLGYTNYAQLWEKKVPAFLQSVILLDDGLPEKKRQSELKRAGANNILCLPLCVEKGLFCLLKDHGNFNLFAKRFSTNSTLNYDICFKDWPLEETSYDTKKFKDWYAWATSQISFEIFYEFWYSICTIDADEFITSFFIAYNSLCEIVDIEPLLMENSISGGIVATSED
jgi:AAA15 family ATPase/GTPase